MRNIRRLMALLNPKAAGVKIEVLQGIEWQRVERESTGRASYPQKKGVGDAGPRTLPAVNGNTGTMEGDRSQSRL
jgi:hypothetical protein